MPMWYKPTDLRTCSQVMQTILLPHTLGTGRHAQMGRLMGTIKGIRKLITFIKRSGAFDKPPTPKDRTQEEEEREERGGGMEHILERDVAMRTYQTNLNHLPPPP